jgi:hypothetical protein
VLRVEAVGEGDEGMLGTEPAHHRERHERDEIAPLAGEAHGLGLTFDLHHKPHGESIVAAGGGSVEPMAHRRGISRALDMLPELVAILDRPSR